jgi:hypothetical protein
MVTSNTTTTDYPDKDAEKEAIIAHLEQLPRPCLQWVVRDLAPAILPVVAARPNLTGAELLAAIPASVRRAARRLARLGESRGACRLLPGSLLISPPPKRQCTYHSEAKCQRSSQPASLRVQCC